MIGKARRSGLRLADSRMKRFRRRLAAINTNSLQRMNDMIEFRCRHCDKLLFKFDGRVDSVVIKCPRCRSFNRLKAGVYEAQPPRAYEQRYVFIVKHI